MIIFENKGSIDVRAIKTFGVNAKENKESAIGYFGTGLKYAIAILLRNGHKIEIISAGTHYVFGVNETKIRNETFNIVTMNGEDLGFTTDLGKNWEMWQAFRELYSNMIDEGGNAYMAGVLDVEPEYTYVTVTGFDFEKVYKNRDTYFLNHHKHLPLHEHPEVSIYAKMSPLTEPLSQIFYKGIRVMESRRNSLFDYNHHCHLQLTEDRTIKDTWSTLWHVSGLVTTSQDKKLIRTMVMAPPDSYESLINFKMNVGADTETFLDEVGKLRKKYKDHGLNVSAIDLHKQLRKVNKVMPGISCHLNKVQTAQLEKAKAFCKDTLELEIDDYQLIICKDIGKDGNYGQADIAEGIMYISKKAFDKGTKCVATAILEEFTHCKHEVLDETLEQKWVYLSQILSLGERINGEPL